VQFIYEEVNPTNLGYVFPEPAMFLYMQTLEHWEVYFKSWLKYQTAFIFCVSSKDFTATPMPTSVWHDEHIENKNESTSRQQGKMLSEQLWAYTGLPAELHSNQGHITGWIREGSVRATLQSESEGSILARENQR
jgi:hypothetical protein